MATLVYDDQGGAGNVDVGWTQRSLNLTAYAGQTIQIRIEAGNTNSNESTLIEAAVDDVIVESITSPDYIFYDDFETGLGWIVNPDSSDSAITGAWERANPESTAYSGVMLQLGGTISGIHNLVTGALAGSGAGSYDIDGGVKAAVLGGVLGGAGSHLGTKVDHFKTNRVLNSGTVASRNLNQHIADTTFGNSLNRRKHPLGTLGQATGSTLGAFASFDTSALGSGVNSSAVSQSSFYGCKK
ncbi:MAG: hypothetical protein R3E57_00140 [Porticoccaceae bacterium]